MNDKILKWLYYIVLVIIILSFFVISYWLFYPYHPLTPLPGHRDLVNKKVRIGEPILYHSRSIRNMAIPYEVNAALVNGELINFPSIRGVQKVGERIFVNSNYVVPRYASTGKHDLEITVIFYVNPIRTIVEKSIIKDIEVIK